ncbi:DNA polymerase ligase N-terminal domain-containing protein [Bremerella cremea]|uniref:DNA polymerase ligase N-terminal domain-containing protein n=1 Tax=Bremerella cremea TaxID=1031537 RepID=UPI0031E9686C
MPRFAILHHRTPSHACKPDHYDLLLEDGDVLKTFTLWEFPLVNEPTDAIPDFDHRMMYLDYEGPISGDRGEVTQADRGSFAWVIREANQIEVELAGATLVGRLIMRLQDSEMPGAGEASSATD